MSSTPGRNDPCPCGSGKKYKQCCLAGRAADDAARLRIRNLERQVVEAVFKYALERWGEPLFHHAWEDFWNYQDVPEDMLATPEFDPMFVPWFTTLFVADPESDRRTPDWPAATLAQEWIAARPGPVEPDLSTYVTQAARSPMSAFAVEDVAPGVSVDVKDLLTGRRFHVLELTASRALCVGDVVFTRVVTMGDASVMFGMAPHAAPPDWQLELLDWRKATFKRRMAMRADLDDFDGEIRDMYFDVRDALLNPVPPVLTNTDGDVLAMVTLTYDLHASVAAVHPLLLPLATLAGEAPAQEVEADATGAVVTARLEWMRPGNRRHASWTNTVLGTLALSEGRLVAEVNSEKRARRLEREIAKRLGGRATLVGRDVIDPLTSLLEERRKDKARKGLRLVEPAPARDPEVAALEATWRRRHAEEWLDTKVPALKGKTPRQAARSAEGRERLEALLLGFARRGSGGGDVAFLREALGLPPGP
ncbi:MAG: SEC-C metal-binding domain-containing protein [Vicinamibacterales bacterium]